MSDEINNKIKKIAGLDIKKARAIILDTIGDDKKQKIVNAKKTPTPQSSSPLFFKDKKFIKQKKEIKLSESEKAKGIQEVKRISGEDKKAGKSPSPLFFKDKKFIKPKKEIKLSESEKAKGIQEVKRMGGEEKKAGASPSPLFFKKKKYIKTGKEGKRKSTEKRKPVKQKKSAVLSAKKISKTVDRGGLKQARPRVKNNIPSKIKVMPEKNGLLCPRCARSVASSVVYIFLTAILLFVIFYSLFVIVITRFDIDNKATRNLSKYLPVPAIITKTGIIEYYDYKDELNRDRGENDLIRGLIGNNSEDASELKVWRLAK